MARSCSDHVLHPTGNQTGQDSLSDDHLRQGWKLESLKVGMDMGCGLPGKLAQKPTQLNPFVYWKKSQRLRHPDIGIDNVGSPDTIEVSCQIPQDTDLARPSSVGFTKVQRDTPAMLYLLTLLYPGVLRILPI